MLVYQRVIIILYHNISQYITYIILKGGWNSWKFFGDPIPSHGSSCSLQARGVRPFGGPPLNSNTSFSLGIEPSNQKIHRSRNDSCLPPATTPSAVWRFSNLILREINADITKLGALEPRSYHPHNPPGSFSAVIVAKHWPLKREV